MYRLVLLSLVFVIFLSMLPIDSYSHRSGCHRWHSCPSDSGSYECGDKGYDDYCSGNDSDDDDDEDEEDNDSNNKKESSTKPRDTTTEGIELSGPVTYVVDGDTLDVNDIRVRLALIDAPEIGENGYETARDFVVDLCLDEDAEVDMDDGQRGGDAYGREIGVVYCDGVNLNSEIIDKELAAIYTEYCEVSEFANEDWADC